MFSVQTSTLPPNMCKKTKLKRMTLMSSKDDNAFILLICHWHLCRRNFAGFHLRRATSRLETLSHRKNKKTIYIHIYIYILWANWKLEVLLKCNLLGYRRILRLEATTTLLESKLQSVTRLHSASGKPL